MNIKPLLTSKDHSWETPPDFFEKLNNEFNFTLDPCAEKSTAKCKKFYTKKEDGLKQNWEGETVFVNPPYGREIGAWVKKGYEESRKENTTVVMLVPARTDTKYFHDFIYNKSEIRFIKGRLKFLRNKKVINTATFPSMIVVFN